MRSTLPSLRDLLASGGFRLRSGTRADCARCEGNSRGTVGYNSEVAHCFRCGWSANRFQLARELGLARGPSQWRRLHRLRKKSGNADTFRCASNVSAAKGAQARVPVLLKPPLNLLFPKTVQHADFRCGRERGPTNQPPQAEACATRGQRASVRRELRRRARHDAAIRAFTRWREARLRQVCDSYLGLSRAALRAGRALASGGLTLDEQELAWDALARFYNEEARLGAVLDFLSCAKAGAWLEDDVCIEELFQHWREISILRK